jgi:hypothetical protein
VQLWPIPQTVPQAPQLELSELRSAQLPPAHIIWPLGQVVAQRPAEQVCGATQALPQRPQCLPSLCTLTHTTPAPVVQAVCPAAQVERQAPAVQAIPAGHALPQTPQFMLSESGETQVPPHAI